MRQQQSKREKEFLEDVLLGFRFAIWTAALGAVVLIWAYLFDR